MSFTTAELQLAAAVWQIAIDIRDDDWSRAHAASDITQKEWGKENPFTDHIDEAMRQIRGIAKHIKSTPQSDAEQI